MFSFSVELSFKRLDIIDVIESATFSKVLALELSKLHFRKFGFTNVKL